MGDVLKVDIGSRTLFRVAAILLGVWFLYLIADVLFVLFAAIVIASALEPLARWLQQYRIPRALSVLSVYLVAIAVFAGVVTLLVPPVAEQLMQLAHALPQLVNRLEGWGLPISTTSYDQVVNALQPALLRFGGDLSGLGANLFQQTRTLFAGAFTFLFVFVIAFYLVLERDVPKRLLRLIVPQQYYPHAAGVVDRVQQNVARWVLAQLTLGFIIGTAVGVGLWLLGVPYALVLGVVAGVFEIVPYIGPILAAIPGVFIGLSQSLVLGVAVLGFYILVQQAENHLLVPTIMRRAVGLNPLITLFAILIGGRFAGLMGVIFAVPAAVVVSIVLYDVLGSRFKRGDTSDASGSV